MSRTSRWERPPAPKDFRWFVRLFGKSLIVLGLLMFGFVAYQLWGTGIEYARAQNRAENQFEEFVAAAAEQSTSLPTTTLPTTTLPTTTIPTTTTVPESSTSAPAETTTTTTTTTLPPTTTSAVPVFDVASLGITDGVAFAQLEIPSIGIDPYVVAGVSREDLQKGPGHYPQTPMPGQLGNSAIAGHRTTWGQPFFDIDEIEPGDEIIVTTPYGRFVYRMTSFEIVDPSNWQVISTTDPTRATLTLTSCHPVYSASQRYIVYAELDVTQSTAPGQPVFNYGRDQVVSTEATLPGEVVATPPPETTTTTTQPTESTAAPAIAETAPSSTSAPTSTTTTTLQATTETLTPDTLYSVVPGGGIIGGEDVSGAGTEAGDGFSNHWFDDTTAWPQVALWGGAAAVVVLAAYELARLVRNSWIGLAAGFAPFLFALYFFYQNVNRLTPAAL